MDRNVMHLCADTGSTETIVDCSAVVHLNWEQVIGVSPAVGGLWREHDRQVGQAVSIALRQFRAPFHECPQTAELARS